MSRRRVYRDDYDSRYHDTRRRTRPPTGSENRRYRVQRTPRDRYEDEYRESRRRQSRYEDYYDDEDMYYDDKPTLFERILTGLTSGRKKKKDKSEEKVIVCNNVKFDSAIVDGFYELVCKIKADAEDTSDGGEYDSEQ